MHDEGNSNAARAGIRLIEAPDADDAMR